MNEHLPSALLVTTGDRSIQLLHGDSLAPLAHAELAKAGHMILQVKFNGGGEAADSWTVISLCLDVA